MAKASRSEGAERFDPRFSPEFQPGFDARKHAELSRSAVRESVVRAPAGSLITRPARRAQDASAEPAAAEAESTAPEAPTAAPTGAVEGVDVEVDADTEPPVWWRRLNPYLVALGVVGVAIIAVAVSWMVWVYEAATSPTVQQFDYLIMQFAMFGAPVLLSVGVLALVSIFVVLAFRWRR